MAQQPGLGMLGKQLAVLPVIYCLNMITLDEEGYEDRRKILYVVFGCLQIIQLALCFYLKQKIKAKNDQGKVHVPAQVALGQVTGEAKEMSIVSYDLSKLQENINTLLIGGVIVCGIVYKMETSKPLLFQLIFGPKTFLESPLVKIHLFNQPAEGSNKRPFVAASPFSGLTPEQPAEEATKNDDDKDNKDASSSSKKKTKESKKD